MKHYDYKDVKFVAHKDLEAGKLIVYAILDGVEVPIAAHKIGHYAHLLKAGAEKIAQEQAATPAIASVPAPSEPVTPHDPAESNPAGTTTTTEPTQ
jgi:hypothetical protein